MPAITSASPAYFSVDGVPKQRGGYEVVAGKQASTVLVGIRPAGRDGWVKGCELRPLADYTDGASGFADLAAFIAHLKSTIFI
jgi:hypothetical protein